MREEDVDLVGRWEVQDLRVECIYEKVKAWAGTDGKAWERRGIKSE
jgi:hypothetical protein